MRFLPDYLKKLLVSMLDGEPAALGLSDALTLQMAGYLNRGGERRADGWYYTLSEEGVALAHVLKADPPQQDQA